VIKQLRYKIARKKKRTPKKKNSSGRRQEINTKLPPRKGRTRRGTMTLPSCFMTVERKRRFPLTLSRTESLISKAKHPLHHPEKKRKEEALPTKKKREKEESR